MLTFIKRGDTGPEVKELQHLLNRKGYPVTIDGNRSPRVQGFSYVLGRMEKLSGYGKIPD
jgi:peptidoglycan hydrolase-like protein with peptidoglycan-binding domain